MMDDRPLRVLFQYSLGRPYRLASASDRQRADESAMQMVRKWRADGVRFISYFGSFAGPGSPDFAHTVLLEVKDLAQVQDMATDLWESDWCAVTEKHHFVIGLGSREAETAWQSA